ncbi:MAG TPA: hypothetical protein VNR65_04650 [Geobacterales bacterium]|nr:hypothetical protein [Geobacterales bacterium]
MTILPLVLVLAFVLLCTVAAIRTGHGRGPTKEEIIQRAREWKLGHMVDPPRKKGE